MTRAFLRCRTCDAEVPATNRFCPACGELYPGRAADEAERDALRAIATEVAPLLKEKARFGAELEHLATVSGERELSADERGQWERAYACWRDVASEITLMVDRIHPRSESDRRTRTTPPPSGAECRSREDRRDPFWTKTP